MAIMELKLVLIRFQLSKIRDMAEDRGALLQERTFYL